MRNSIKMDYESRRSSSSGGHILFIEYDGQETDFQITREMERIKAETDDAIDILTIQNEIESINWNSILNRGKALVEEGKRLWLFFYCDFDFNTNTMKDFLAFLAKARPCGVIVTMEMDKLIVSRDMLGAFLANFEGIYTTNSIIKGLIGEEESKKTEEELTIKEELSQLQRYIRLKDELEEMEKQARKYKIIIGSVTAGLCGVAIIVWKYRKKRR